MSSTVGESSYRKQGHQFRDTIVVTQLKNNKTLTEEEIELMRRKIWIIRHLCYIILGIWQLICFEAKENKALVLRDQGHHSVFNGKRR